MSAKSRQTRLKMNHARRTHYSTTQSRSSPLHTPPTTPPASRQTLSQETSLRSKSILSHFQVPHALMIEYDAMNPLKTTDKAGFETSIPVTYVRAKGATRFIRTWMSRSAATHYLLLEQSIPTLHDARGETPGTPPGRQGALYPIHSWVMASQSTTWNARVAQLAKSNGEGEEIDEKPVVSLVVPHLPSVDTLLMFLHSHDESALYRTLCKYWQDGSDGGEEWIVGFIDNVVALGILDRRLRGVVWAVIEPEKE